MSEEVKNEEKKTKVNVIKKTVTPQPVKVAPAKSEENAHEVEKKVIVLKKKPVVKVKEKEPEVVKAPEVPVVEKEAPKTEAPKAEAPVKSAAPNKPVVRENRPQSQKPQQNNRVQPNVNNQNRPARENIIAGKSFMTNSSSPANNRIQSPLHNGPVIIKTANLPPVPGQKVEAASAAAPAKPRVAGIVGGRPTGGFKGQGNNRNRQNNKDGQARPPFNKDGRPNMPKAGQSYTPGNGQGKEGGFRRDGARPNNGFAPRGPRPQQGAMGGGAPAGQAVELNQKSKGKNFNPGGKKKDRESKYQKDEELDFQLQKKKKEEQKLAAVPKQIDIMENITVADLAKKMNLKASDIISKLFKMGLMVTINQQIDHETAEIICEEYGCSVHLVSLYDETIIESEEDREEDMVPRAPIVTIMGHVDHGKTKLLDAIRSTNVAGGEFGGITQHIGAYKVNVPEKGEVVFLDTPGHAAFSMMRARGAQVTDIVVLVVAANDGVMPQTREAVDHAKAAKVPIIVAINKCDLPEAKPERVMQQLSDLGLMPEEWGGQTLYCQISALKKLGIDDLLDTILLQAEMLELRANPTCRAVGKVLESRIDQGRGTVATVMVEKGTLRQGDYYVAGIYSGRVRAMFDDKGKKIKEAGPSTPVEIIGLSNIPSAGDPFQVTEDEKQARSIATKRQELERIGEGSGKNKITLENLNEKILEGQVTDFNVVIKGDVQGSVEALQGVLQKLSTAEIKLNVLRASAGAIIESDITLAAASDAVVIGFNVRPTPRAQALAEQEKVEIKKYNVIYDVVDDIRDAMEGKLSPEIKEVDIGKVEIRDTFKVPKVGIIAGAYVQEGRVKRNSLVRVIRDSIQINRDMIKISSLKRFKDDAKEVTEGYECGIGLENWQDLQVGDILEIVETEEIRRTLEVVEI